MIFLRRYKDRNIGIIRGNLKIMMIWIFADGFAGTDQCMVLCVIIVLDFCILQTK
jgi:hypothetical protein